MRVFFQSIKNFAITVTFNILCILAWLANGLQALYNFVVGVIQLPHQLLKALSVMMCICAGLGFAIAGKGNVGNLILNLVAMILVMGITYKIAEFILNLLLILVVAILKLLDPSTVLVGLVSFADKLQSRINYQAPCANNYFTYFIARILTKLDWLLRKVFRVVAFAMYPISIGGGLFALWCSVSKDFSMEATTWGVTEYVCAVVLITCVVVISSMVAHTFRQAIIDSCDAASLLDELFDAYLDRNYNYQNTNEQKQQDYKDYQANYYDYTEETPVTMSEANPYDSIFDQIDNEVELKKQFRRMAKELHPDVNTQLSYEQANQEMAQLNAAYERACARFTTHAKV